ALRSTVKKASPFIFSDLGRSLVGLSKLAASLKLLPYTTYLHSFAPGKLGKAAPENCPMGTPLNSGSSFFKKSKFLGEYSAQASPSPSDTSGCSPSNFQGIFSPLNMALAYSFRAALSPVGSG